MRTDAGLNEQSGNRAAPLITEEELDWVKRSVLLTLVLDVLERDIRTMRGAPLKGAGPYIAKLRAVQERVTGELAGLRKRLRLHGLKVYAQKRTQLAVEVRYLCRGSDHA